MEQTDFGWAIRRLKEGLKVARKGWNGKGIFFISTKRKSNQKC